MLVEDRFRIRETVCQVAIQRREIINVWNLLFVYVNNLRTCFTGVFPASQESCDLIICYQYVVLINIPIMHDCISVCFDL